jgi:hypothetical protein
LSPFFALRLAADLNINPGLVKSMLNQFTSFEQFYSLVDDAKAQTLKPVIDRGFEGGYTLPGSLPVRSLEYIRGTSPLLYQQVQASQVLGK